MAHYCFYYDESEHSRKINLKTVKAENYYDNFIAAIVGWEGENEEAIFKKYAVFEEKYASRKSNGELKSQTLKQNQFKNGFASLNKNSVCFLNDFLSMFDSNIPIYFAAISKVEFIITQLFAGYKNSFLCDMDAMKYSIVKTILVYQPKEIIEGVFENTGELVVSLRTFFKERIQKNSANLSLKQSETEAFEEILRVINDVQEIKTIEWDYGIAFWGFKQYLKEQTINDFTLVIDKEGERGNTLNAAKRMGFNTVMEVDSKDSVGVRISDMLAGLLSKLLKALHNSLRYNSSDEQLQKKILSREWFFLSQEQLELYKKLHIVVCEANNAWYKTFSGKYSDDLIVLIALLNYMNQFSTTAEIRNQNIDMHGEYFNAYACDCLTDYFFRMKGKLPIDIIAPNSKDHFFNQRGAKVFFDTQRQPLLKLKNRQCKYNILSIGLSREGIPLVTISEQDGAYCYRLPNDLSEWAMTVVGMANMGSNLFPAEVAFSKLNGKIYADIL